MAGHHFIDFKEALRSKLDEATDSLSKLSQQIEEKDKIIEKLCGGIEIARGQVDETKKILIKTFLSDKKDLLDKPINLIARICEERELYKRKFEEEQKEYEEESETEPIKNF